METLTNWNPPTLLDAINEGYIPAFESFAPLAGQPLKVKYKCDCGAFAWPQCFHDVRGIPLIEGSFICDGCYTKIERNLDDIDGEGKPETRRDFKRRYIKLQGAPLELQLEVGKRLDYLNNERQQKLGGRKLWL